jgi:hypothetical protein
MTVMRFLIPQYLTYENGDCVTEVFLLITVFELSSSFGIVFQGFREVVSEDIKPSGAISVTQYVLKFQERLGPAPVESSPCLV